MKNKLFTAFEPTSAAAWKQKIQVDLKGEDYNSLIWKTDDGIAVKPFYTKADRNNLVQPTTTKQFAICQSVFVDDVQIANHIAITAIRGGVVGIQFVAKKPFDVQKLIINIPETTIIYFDLQFLDVDFTNNLYNELHPKYTFYIQLDIIGNHAKTGNWFTNLKTDFEQLSQIIQNSKNCISISSTLYQNAGATIVQQLAYTLAHANEYVEYFGENSTKKIHFNIAVGANYFFEIAKLNSLKILWQTLTGQEAHLFCKPTLRNKSIYDYNVNMLRTTTECMSAALGGAHTICNVPYDVLYKKSNAFGERIARNQLLILKEESYFKNANAFIEGSYYIDALTLQFAEKALEIFKQIEKAGGFLQQLKKGSIQKKIEESAAKEQASYDANQLKHLGTNFQPNKTEQLKNQLDFYPFPKKREEKTLIIPIKEKRLTTTYEKKRLENE